MRYERSGVLRAAAACCMAWLVSAIPAQGHELVSTTNNNSTSEKRAVQATISLPDSAVPGRIFEVTNVNVPGSTPITLALRQMKIASGRLQAVRGSKAGADTPIAYDGNSTSSYFGYVRNHPGSRVFITQSSTVATGRIQLDGKTFYISNKDAHGTKLAAGQFTIFSQTGVTSSEPAHALCGLDTTQHTPQESANGIAGTGPITAPSILPHRIVEMAVDTDYELYSLFNDEQAVIDYTVALMADVSEVYIHDVSASFEVVFVRVWPTPDDLYNEANPLGPLVDEWQTNMTHVQRDLATLFTGRRDLPYGGVAYLSSTCGPTGFSINGYLTGEFPAPNIPASGHYGVRVIAHEIGHNFGSPHTPDYLPAIDQCFPPPTIPQRGTLMSYCSQTVSGGRHANDIRFHARVQEIIRGQIENAPCLTDDCNFNGIDDLTDISQATSDDANSNGIPDECEDCNNNATFDADEILLGLTDDVNGNLIPDSCELDCNNNGIPDTHDIASGTSLDAYGNNVPDECEEDCNDNDIADYTEIQADLSLDVDRNTRLDACQDCDGNLLTDAEDLASAHNLWIASNASDTVGEFHAQTGVRASASGSLPDGFPAYDVLITPNGRILASIPADDSVFELNAQGGQLGYLVTPGSGGLSSPGFMAISPDGRLTVASRGSNTIIQYDLNSGAFDRVMVPSTSGGLGDPEGITFGPDGHLYVSSTDNDEILRFDGSSGLFIDEFVPRLANGGLSGARDLTFIPDGRLIVAGFNSNDLHAYDGQTGESLGSFVYGGDMIGPIGVEVGPNGNVFVTRNYQLLNPLAPTQQQWDDESDDGPQPLHVTTTRIYEYDYHTGFVLGSFIVGDDTGLTEPVGIAFFPGFDKDCNVNFTQDACDILSGFSADTNTNDIPDECEVDCNTNGVFDRQDIIPFGQSYDCNANRVPDECDIGSGQSTDCNNNLIPDDCEAECNGNGLPDDCDISSGASTDCNLNGVPDECEPDCNGNQLPDQCDLDSGESADCNKTGVPDDCELEGLFTTTSDQVGPIGDGQDVFYIVPEMPLPIDDIQVIVTAHADLGNSAEFLDLFMNDEHVVTIFTNTGVDCPSTSDAEYVLIPLEEYVSALSTGEIEFRLVASPAVNADLCPDGSSVTFGFEYLFNADCNGNGLLDECKPAGNDCDSNGIGDACDIINGSALDCDTNGVPDSCDIDSGTSPDENGNGIPDVCDAQTPLAEDTYQTSCGSDSDCLVGATCANGTCYAPRNRYLSLSPNPGNTGRLTARRVTVSTGQGEPIVIGYITPPLGGPGGKGPQSGMDETNLAGLNTDPVFADWSTYPDPLYVMDCAIVPGYEYILHAVNEGVDAADESNYSQPVSIKTTAWGDVVGDYQNGVWSPGEGVKNFIDIFATVLGFQNALTAPHTSWVDIDGIFPNQVVNFADIQQTAQAFQGADYPFFDPCSCMTLPPCPLE